MAAASEAIDTVESFTLSLLNVRSEITEGESVDQLLGCSIA